MPANTFKSHNNNNNNNDSSNSNKPPNERTSQFGLITSSSNTSNTSSSLSAIPMATEAFGRYVIRSWGEDCHLLIKVLTDLLSACSALYICQSDPVELKKLVSFYCFLHKLERMERHRQHIQGEGLTGPDTRPTEIIIPQSQQSVTDCVKHNNNNNNEIVKSYREVKFPSSALGITLVEGGPSGHTTIDPSTTNNDNTYTHTDNLCSSDTCDEYNNYGEYTLAKQESLSRYYIQLLNKTYNNEMGKDSECKNNNSNNNSNNIECASCCEVSPDEESRLSQERFLSAIQRSIVNYCDYNWDNISTVVSVNKAYVYYVSRVLVPFFNGLLEKLPINIVEVQHASKSEYRKESDVKRRERSNVMVPLNNNNNNIINNNNNSSSSTSSSSDGKRASSSQIIHHNEESYYCIHYVPKKHDMDSNNNNSNNNIERSVDNISSESKINAFDKIQSPLLRIQGEYSCVGNNADGKYNLQLKATNSNEICISEGHNDNAAVRETPPAEDLNGTNGPNNNNNNNINSCNNNYQLPPESSAYNTEICNSEQTARLTPQTPIIGDQQQQQCSRNEEHPRKRPSFIFMGGGMGAGKSTAAAAVLHSSWWKTNVRDTVIIDPDVFKSTSYREFCLNGRGEFKRPSYGDSAAPHMDKDIAATLLISSRTSSPILTTPTMYYSIGNTAMTPQDKEHYYSIEASKQVLVHALNNDMDVVFDGTMSWQPYVKQTIDMVRQSHLYYYSVGPGWSPEDNVEEYWIRGARKCRRAECQSHSCIEKETNNDTLTGDYKYNASSSINSELNGGQICSVCSRLNNGIDGDSHSSSYSKGDTISTDYPPYWIRFIGITLHPRTAVQRGVLRHIITDRAVPIQLQLRAFRLFSEGYEEYCKLCDSVILYNNNVDGEAPVIIAKKVGNGENKDPFAVSLLSMSDCDNAVTDGDNDDMKTNNGDGDGGHVILDKAAYADFLRHRYINQNATGHHDMWLDV